MAHNYGPQEFAVIIIMSISFVGIANCQKRRKKLLFVSFESEGFKIAFKVHDNQVIALTKFRPKFSPPLNFTSLKNTEK